MRRATRLMMMQEGRRGETRDRDGEYSPRRDGRMAIGYKYDEDFGRFNEYGAPYGYLPNPHWREPHTPPSMRGGNTVRGSGSFEMEYPRHGRAQSARDDLEPPIDERTARAWVQRMQGGEKFSMQQADEMRKSVGARCSPYAFYVALNMMYSDYGTVAKQMNTDKPEFYAHMAKAFIEDADAKDHKLRRYMESIAE